MGPRSWDAATRAAGAVVDAVDKVLDGALDRAFCNVRPPGHHATPGRAMGFCLFNNVAVGAAAALARGLKRVAVIDFDVHHGNGTQEAFWRDPRVLFVSSHQFPYYPGTGALDEVGEGEGRGFTVNLPMPAGLGDGEYRRAYREIVEPIGRAFDPELVLVSAGFDAHRDDPLGGMDLERGRLRRADGRVPRGGIRGRRAGGSWPSSRAATTSTGSPRPRPRSWAGCSDAPSPPPDAAPRPGFERLLEAYRTAHAEHWPVVR